MWGSSPALLDLKSLELGIIKKTDAAWDLLK
jgi:hypothetical protein